MSKLYDALSAFEVRRVIDMPCLDIKANTVNAPLTHAPLVEYTVVANIGARAVAHPGDMQQAKDNAWRLINEEVFGEFRPLILEVRRALYIRDYKKADQALGVLYDRMFT